MGSGSFTVLTREISVRLRIPKLVRLPISLGIGFVLACSLLLDFVAVIEERLPLPVAWFLNLPGFIYCRYLMATEPLPADDIPLFQAGQAAQCFFVGIALNVPYYALLIYLCWWSVDKWRARTSENVQQ